MKEMYLSQKKNIKLLISNTSNLSFKKFKSEYNRDLVKYFWYKKPTFTLLEFKLTKNIDIVIFQIGLTSSTFRIIRFYTRKLNLNQFNFQFISQTYKSFQELCFIQLWLLTNLKILSKSNLTYEYKKTPQYLKPLMNQFEYNIKYL